MNEVLAMPTGVLVAFVAMNAFAALVQGTLGFGFAIVSVPVLVLIDPRLAPVPQLLVQLPLCAYLYWRERRDAEWRGVLWVTVGGVPGTAIGVWLLAVATGAALDLLNGVLVLGGVAALAFGLRLRRNVATESFAGVLSGISSTVSAMGGPPVALLYEGARGPTVRATLSLIFLLGVILSILGRMFADDGMASRDLALTALACAPVAFGLWASRFLTGRVEGRPMRLGILGLSALSGLGLVGRAIATW
ncbi:MAG: sulfite exporter TauE/SafE family protein [Sandaracinus sp.]|nr:sulfite exporter TauE/SafE family protein [Sandaracinus sp.]